MNIELPVRWHIFEVGSMWAVKNPKTNEIFCYDTLVGLFSFMATCANEVGLSDYLSELNDK